MSERDPWEITDEDDARVLDAWNWTLGNSQDQNRAANMELRDRLRERVEAHYAERERRLVEALRTSATRLEILLGRMRGCDGEHEVSKIEVPGWVDEVRALLAEMEADVNT